MTTFQDPPPQSRRAARESERAQQTASGVDYMAQINDAPLDDSEPRPSGRRVRSDAGPPSDVTPEPLNYATEARPQAATYEAPSFARTQPEETGEQPAFRMRDFSPEGRRGAPQPSFAPPVVEPVVPPANLDYRTQAGPGIVHPAEGQTPAAWEAPASVEPPALIEPPDPHHTMTRRELRLLREQQDAAAESGGLFAVEQPAVAVVSAPPEAMAEFETLVQAAPAPEPAVTEPPTFDDLFAPRAEEPIADRLANLPPPSFDAPAAAAVFQPPVFETEPEVDDVDPEDSAPIDLPLLDTPVPESAEPTAWPFTNILPTVQPEADAEPWSPPSWNAPEETLEAPHVRETYTPPVGHWSRQADLDDENQPYENTQSRLVGGSNVSTTTSALILPNIPQDFASLINSTGEILVTGTIDLPASLGTTGGDSRRYDDPNVDHMFDRFDSEIVSNDSAPVRAIRAVSTHTSSRGVIQATKPKGNRLLTVGIITACVLAVGVIGLLAVYIISTLNK